MPKRQGRGRVRVSVFHRPEMLTVFKRLLYHSFYADAVKPIVHGMSLLEELPPNGNISAKATSLGGVSFSIVTENCRPPSSKPSWVIEMESAINESVEAENQSLSVKCDPRLNYTPL